MSLFNKKSAGDSATQSGNSGKSQLSLLILLLLLAVFGYLYFFTSLIVPHETPPAAPPAPLPQVKQAMPPRGAEVPAAPAGGVTTPQGVQPQAATATPPQPSAQTTPPALPQPAPPAAAKPAPPAAAKVETKPAPAVKKEEQKPAAPAVKAPEKVAKTAPVPAAGAKEQKPAAAIAEKKAPKAEKTPPRSPAKKRATLYALNLGEFPAGAQTAAVEEKLARLKIKQVSKLQTKKNRQMNRLFYNAYSDYDASSAELDKLKKLSKSSFAVEKDGKYYLYTGSFSSAELAQQEKKRLSGSGVKVELQRVQLPAQLVQIAAGEFTSKAAADKAAASLRGQGLQVKVVPKRK